MSTDHEVALCADEGYRVLRLPAAAEVTAPILYTLHCSYWPITLRCSRAPTSINREISRKSVIVE